MPLYCCPENSEGVKCNCAQNKSSAVPSNDGTMPTAEDMESIVSLLEKEPVYSDDEIEEMLESASFKCHSEGIDVTYSNGVVDRFIRVTKLFHENDELPGWWR